MKKIIITFLVFLSIIGLVLPLVGCGSSDETITTKNQTTTVQRGDLALEITAAGNLALSTTQDLTFDLFYQEGTVNEVNVVEGDTVVKGQVLATLDSSEWNDEIQTLQDALTTAQEQVATRERTLVSARHQATDVEKALATAERQVTTKEAAVTTAQSDVTSKQMAVTQAQLNLETAQYNLDQIDEIKEQQDIIDNAEYQLQFLSAKITESLSPSANSLDYGFWTQEKTRVEKVLSDAREEITAILSGTSMKVTTTVAILVKQKQLDIDTARFNLEKANQAVADAQTSVEDAGLAVEDAKSSVEDAQYNLDNAKLDVISAQANVAKANTAVEDAQKTLDDAKAASPEIIAPFDGFVTRVNVAGGDQVMKGTVAIQLADPSKFEAEILVGETDILNVSLGDNATISADAISDVSFPAEVTHISPTATISSSVVNYSVTVELLSLKPIATKTQSTGFQMPSGNFTLPEGFTPPADFTPSSDFTPPSGTAPSSGQVNSQTQPWSGTSGNTATSTSETEYTLKEGMTVTVTITIIQRADVLLVPSAAISTQGGQSYVEVISSSGETEQRVVKTGESDDTNTEITSGITEGEEVVVSKISTSSAARTTTTTTTQNRNNGIMIPGMGGGPGQP
jgi:multidrug efflux pump subunit AcrA (membrane-fusion protein)